MKESWLDWSTIPLIHSTFLHLWRLEISEMVYLVKSSSLMCPIPSNRSYNHSPVDQKVWPQNPWKFPIFQGLKKCWNFSSFEIKAFVPVVWFACNFCTNGHLNSLYHLCNTRGTLRPKAECQRILEARRDYHLLSVWYNYLKISLLKKSDSNHMESLITLTVLKFFSQGIPFRKLETHSSSGCYKGSFELDMSAAKKFAGKTSKK